MLCRRSLKPAPKVRYVHSGFRRNDGFYGIPTFYEFIKVKVKLIGVSEPTPGFERSQEVPIDFPGNSLGDLVKHLLSGMDSKGREIFLNEQGRISPDLVVIVNGIAVSDSSRFDLGLNEGDRIELISSPG